jgi:hypothetical protein
LHAVVLDIDDTLLESSQVGSDMIDTIMRRYHCHLEDYIAKNGSFVETKAVLYSDIKNPAQGRAS